MTDNLVEQLTPSLLASISPFFDRCTIEGDCSGEAKKAPLNEGYGGGFGKSLTEALNMIQSAPTPPLAFLVVPQTTYGNHITPAYPYLSDLEQALESASVHFLCDVIYSSDGKHPGIPVFVPPIEQRTNQYPNDTLLGVERTPKHNAITRAGWSMNANGKLGATVRAAYGCMAQFTPHPPTTLFCDRLTVESLAKSEGVELQFNTPSKTGFWHEDYNDRTTTFVPYAYYVGFRFDVNKDGSYPQYIDVLVDDGLQSLSFAILTNPKDWVLAHPGRTPLLPLSLTGEWFAYDPKSKNHRTSAIFTGYFYPTTLLSTCTITL